jgi:hypothetical protein
MMGGLFVRRNAQPAAIRIKIFRHRSLFLFLRPNEY